MNGPLYRQVEILDSEQHGDLRLKRAEDIGYAAGLRDCPIVVDEFMEAAKTYPIVFARDEGGRPMAVVVMGFPDTGNLWGDATGHWRPANYVPAYVRRYPFVAVERDDVLLLGLDMAFEGVGADDGEPLFEPDGAPTPTLMEASAFMDEFLLAHARTNLFLADLLRLDLLTPFNAEVTSEGNRSLLGNLLCVDKARLDALPSCELLDFVRNGHYALAMAHLSSLTNFATLSALMRPAM